MRALRGIEPGLPMNLHVDGNVKQRLSRSELCLQLALRALGNIERNHEALFMSNLELVRLETIKSLNSDNLLRLARLDLQGLDAPSALMKVSAAQINNLVSVGQNRSMRLYFLALPAGMRPFKRIISPVTPQNDRPSNFRVLSVAEMAENDALVII